MRGVISGRDEEEDMGFMRIIAKGVVPKFVMRRGVLRVQETSGLEKQERGESKAGRARTVRERERWKVQLDVI